MSESESAAGSGLERREFIAGAAAMLVALVGPRVALAGDGNVSAAKEGSWDRFVDAAEGSIARGVDAWAAGAGVAGGEVNGSAVFVPPGALNSDVDFRQGVDDALLKAGAGEDVAAALSGVAWEGWRGWSSSYSLSLPDGVRAFAAVPGPEAPSTTLEPMRLHDGSALGRIGMSADAQSEALRRLLAQHLNEPGAADAIDRYTRWYEKSFDKWFQHAIVENLVAKGPVPSFAPPYVPVGPVVRGDVSGTAVLVAADFGSEPPTPQAAGS